MSAALPDGADSRETGSDGGFCLSYRAKSSRVGDLTRIVPADPANAARQILRLKASFKHSQFVIKIFVGVRPTHDVQDQLVYRLLDPRDRVPQRAISPISRIYRSCIDLLRLSLRKNL